MAKRIMKKVIKDKNLENIKVLSRGLFATGENINPNAKYALKELGFQATNHKSVKLKKIDKNTLYVTMNEKQKESIDTKKVVSFASLIGKEIEDPYGKDKEYYLQTAKDILKGTNILVEKLELWRW